MQLYWLIYYSQSVLLVSEDVFAHNQEHLTVFTVSGTIHSQVAAVWCHGWVGTAVPTHPLHQTAATWEWILPDAVNTVKCSWLWTKTSPETGRADYKYVTNVKYKLLCVRFLHINFCIFWICMLKWLLLDSILFLIVKRTIAHSCNSALICQFPILSKRLTPTLTRSVCLNCKIYLCIISL